MSKSMDLQYGLNQVIKKFLKLAVIQLPGYTSNIEIEFVSTHNGSYQGDKAIDKSF